VADTTGVLGSGCGSGSASVGAGGLPRPTADDMAAARLPLGMCRLNDSDGRNALKIRLGAGGGPAVAATASASTATTHGSAALSSGGSGVLTAREGHGRLPLVCTRRRSQPHRQH
jgi:hypothetical protein